MQQKSMLCYFGVCVADYTWRESVAAETANSRRKAECCSFGHLLVEVCGQQRASCPVFPEHFIQKLYRMLKLILPQSSL